jgi:hypothetical protein
MKNLGVFILISSISCLSNSDMVMPPEMSSEFKAWDNAKCDDLKNLIICSFPSECPSYSNKPDEFKLIAMRGSNTNGAQKYCRIQSKEDDSFFTKIKRFFTGS